MKIGFDLDEVLVEFADPFLEFHNFCYGTSLKREECSTYFFEKIIGVTQEEIIKRISEFHKSSFAKGMIAVSGS